MNVFAVGMTVDEQGRVEALDGFVGKGRIDVHNVGGFVLFVLFALLTDFGGNVQSECEWQKQEQALQPFLMDGTAEFLIRMVIGAEGVAVTEQGGCAEQVDNGVLGQ